MTVAYTTSLPDAQQPSLGNGVEDEVAVSTPDVLNNGDYRIQIRETGQDSWGSSVVGFAEKVISADGDTSGTVETIFTGLEDGEEYEARIRTETEHKTGEWTQPVSITTQFPGAANPTVGAVSATSIPVDVQDNADNETGFRLEREEQIDGVWADRRVVAERGPHAGEGAMTITDDTASPGAKYRWRVEAYTEHTSAVSSWTAAVETPGLEDAPRASVSSSDWHVEIDHASGATHTPRVLEATPQQRLNNTPKLTLEVPRDDKWTARGFEDAPIRAYRDGIRQPITQLDDAGHTGDRTTLVASGGHQLQRKATHQFDQTPVDDAVRTLLQETTDYVVDVDDYSSETTPDQLQQSSQLTSWQNLIPSQYYADTEPLSVRNGYPELHRTTWLGYIQESASNLPNFNPKNTIAFDGNYTVVGEGTTNTQWIAGRAAKVAGAGYFVDITFVPEHDVPADRVGVAYHGDITGSGTPGTLQFVHPDGSTTVVDDAPAPSGDWTHNTSPGVGMLEAGSTYSLELYGSPDFAYRIDGLGVYDTMYAPGTWGEPSGDGPIESPRLYPQAYEFELVTATPPVSVTGARIASEASPAPPQGLGLSNDQGSSWPLTATDSSSLDGSFNSLGATVTARVTLGATTSDTGTAPPTSGNTGHELTSIQVYADLDDIPLAIDEVHDDPLLGELQSYAEYADSLFQLVWNTDQGKLEVEWSTPGGRGVRELENVVDYDISKSTRARVDQIRVEGSALEASQSYAGSIYDTEFDLNEANLVSGSESVSIESSDETYQRHVDYQIQYNPGTIEFLSSGNIPSDATVVVSYQYKPQGSAWLTNPSDVDVPTLRERTIQGLVTDRGCEIAARRIKRRVQEPLWEADVTVSRTPEDWGVLQLIDPGVVDVGDGGLEVREITPTSGGGLSLRLAVDDFSEVFADVRDRIEAVSQRT
ncbi:fibronectin type III domain-containing protein [Halobacterium sp. KA-6]|uniref:fibronectin type III domain-containing protein n=1 Tax=Halobacterium sp. KA-6 TaxID=2896368 RepID=UPI001E516D2D|nr:fibronectin type III domain-containing protein [Halobacterium sp. KA-6]MCD2204403.1 fibronectin type III domain-containing protein [Halobacterium sp. KA-6]